MSFKGQRTVKSVIYRIKLPGQNATLDLMSYNIFKNWRRNHPATFIESVIRIERKDIITDVTLREA
jgi:hypothetical protein